MFEPKYYHFQSGETFQPFKDEVFTYRSELELCPLAIGQLEQLMRTVFYGIDWFKFQDQREILRKAIIRETGGPYKQHLAILRNMLNEFADALEGSFKNDEWDYREVEEDDDEY